MAGKDSGVHRMDSLEIIERLGSGVFADRFANELERVGAEVVQTGRKGSLVVKFDVECVDNSVEDPIVGVQPSFKLNMPQRSAAATAFYFADGGFRLTPKSQQAFPEEVYDPERMANDGE